MWWNVLLILAAIVIKLVQSCPIEMCTCKWKGGKQTVECSSKFLTNIPEGMDPSTQVLNFSENSLVVLQNERFRNMELINLQKIYLSKNQIYRINERAFRGLSNLIELDLSENRISSIPTETFQDYTSLMRLILNGNPVKELKTSAFRHLAYLTTLELNNCEIDKIHDDAFVGLDNLEWLRLDNNKITTVEGSNILPITLHGISLHENPWTCDCHLRDIYTWLNRFQTPQIEEPFCAAPLKLSGHEIKTINVDDLACAPDIEPTSLFLEVCEGRNITLICKVRATPEAHISWWFNGQLVSNETVSDHIMHDFIDFIDERHTELSIYHTNTEDNGTFACIAENSAGRTQANYTLRVIIKEEPIVKINTFPYEYLIVVIAGAGCVILTFAITICISLCKSRKRAKRKKSDKVSITVEEKLNGSILLTENNAQDVMLYITNSTQNESHLINNFQLTSPHRSFQDQNPDLINDAERSKVELDKAIRFGTPSRDQQRSDLYQVDVHLNPKFNGFPHIATPVHYYRTLPHKKAQVSQGLRCFNEAEFITSTRTTQTQTYAPDIRYTVQGYPMSAFPSPPEGYKELISSNTIPNNLTIWPPVLPGYAQLQEPQIIPIKIQSRKNYQPQMLQTKCGSVHTSEADTIPEHPDEEAEETEAILKHLTGPLADSPDEGYVGDCQEGPDM